MRTGSEHRFRGDERESRGESRLRMLPAGAAEDKPIGVAFMKRTLLCIMCLTLPFLTLPLSPATKDKPTEPEKKAFEPKPVVAVRTEESVAIDGVLSERSGRPTAMTNSSSPTPSTALRPAKKRRSGSLTTTPTSTSPPTSMTPSPTESRGSWDGAIPSWIRTGSSSPWTPISTGGAATNFA